MAWQFSNAKPRHHPINYLQENNAKEDAKGYEQPYEGFPSEIDAIASVDNLIAAVFILFKHLSNVYTVLIIQLFLFLIIRFVLGLQLFDRLYRMRYDREGYLWIGSLDGDLVQLTTDGPRYYPINNVKDIMQLPDDRMLIGTTHGLFIIHPSTGKSEELNYAPANENDVNKFIHALYLVFTD